MQLSVRRLALAGAALLIAASADPAMAYLGPGLGLGAITTALGVLGAILLGIVSVIWYPVKRLIRRLRGKSMPVRPAPNRPPEGDAA